MVGRTLPLPSGTKKSKAPFSFGKMASTSNADLTSDFLKERLFGLSNPQGNHGESIKEAHFHLDNTPVSGASQLHIKRSHANSSADGNIDTSCTKLPGLTCE